VQEARGDLVLDDLLLDQALEDQLVDGQAPDQVTDQLGQISVCEANQLLFRSN